MKKILLSLLIAAVALTAAPARTEDFLSLENLALPESLGTIEGRFVAPGSARWIVQIQDVHAHLTAQENIAAILEHLNAVYGIQTIALEGSWTGTTFPQTRKLTGLQREKQMLARGLLEENLLTGPGYAALFTQTPLRLAGVEKEDLYEENRALYKEHLKHRDEILERFTALIEQIQAEKQSAYNRDLLLFDAHLMQFRAGRKAEDFIPALVEQAQTRELDLTNSPQVLIFLQALAIEKSIDEEKLKAEAARLMKTFKDTRLHFEELLVSGKVPEEKLSHYPASLQYRELLQMRSRLQYRDFFDEIEKLITQFKELLFANEEERKLDARSEALLLASRITFFEATPDDLKTYEAVSQNAQSILAEAGLENALRLGLAFYKTAKRRDAVFFNKLMNDSRLSGNVAVVTGGFHTEGLSALFEQGATSYIVIRPELGEEKPNEKLYFQRIREELPGAEALADLRNRYTARFDAALAEGVRAMSELRDLRQAIAVVLQKSAAPAEESAPAAVSGDFKSLPAEEQGKIAARIREMQAGQKTILLVVKASVLKELFKDRLALTAWHEEILSRSENRVIIVNDVDEILTETIGGRARVKRLSGDIGDLIRKERAKFTGTEMLTAVIDTEYAAADPQTLVLKPHPAAFLLIRPLLEFKDQSLNPSDFAVLDLFAQIMTNLYESQGVLRSA